MKAAVTTAEGKLHGPLGFAQVPLLVQQADALCASGVLDLGGVSQIDSAGLALLLELSRRCKARGLRLVIRAARPQIMQLGQFFGIDHILHFE